MLWNNHIFRLNHFFFYIKACSVVSGSNRFNKNSVTVKQEFNLMKQELVRNIWSERPRHCLVECKVLRSKYSCRMKKENWPTHFKIRTTNVCSIFVKVKLEWLQAYKKTTNISNWKIDLNRSKTWVSFWKPTFCAGFRFRGRNILETYAGWSSQASSNSLKKKKSAVKMSKAIIGKMNNKKTI